MYVRCAKCRGFLAGPVDIAPGVPEFGRSEDSGTAIVGPWSYYAADDWILLHPRWCFEWFVGATEDLHDSDPEAIGRGKPLVTARGFGCCGPDGDALCGKGHVVGRVQGDCWHDQWIRLSRDAIETSDEVDGDWQVFDLRHEARLRLEGRFAAGLRVGTWSVYAETAEQVQVRGPGPGLKGRWIDKLRTRARFTLLRLERYEDGRLVESTDA